MLGRSILLLALAAAVPVAAGTALRTVAQGQTSPVQQPSRQVIRTQAEWTAFWKAKFGDREAPPKVDFSREMVLAAFMGTQRTGGYKITLTGAREEKGKLVVTVTEQKPPPTAMVIQVITSPFHIVAVKKSGLAVEWRVTQQTPPAGRGR